MAIETRSGKNWIMLKADSLVALRELRELVPHDRLDGLICDPPYSSGGFVRGDRTIDAASKYVTSGVEAVSPTFPGDNRDQRGFLAWMSLWLADAYAALREGAPFGVFSDWRQLPTMTDAVQAGGFVWRGIVPWSKGGASRPQMGRFRNDAEYFIWGSKGAMALDESVGCLGGTWTNVPDESWTATPVAGKERVHITQKPLEVMLQAVAVVRPGGVVLDPFTGSGSTGVAAIRTGRAFVGIEVDPYFFDLSCERLTAEENNLSLEAARRNQLPLFGA